MSERSNLIWTWEVTTQDHRSAELRADILILQAWVEQSSKATEHPLPSLTRSQLQRLIKEERVTVDGNPLKARTKLKSGMLVEIKFPKPQPTHLVPENRPIEVLFEDEYLLVVNKPPGLTVHPSPTQMEGTLVHALLHHIQDLSGIGGILRPGIVHRIDKNTSGALVITKTDAAHLKLADICYNYLNIA